MPSPPGESLIASRLDAIGTCWSLVQKAHGEQSLDMTAARQALVLRYARAIRRYIGGIIRGADDADELAQDVVMRLMRGDFAGADPNRGRFRDFLKTAVRNMVHNTWAKANKRKTADVQLDLLGQESHDPTWDHEWQQSVLEQTWNALKAQEKQQSNVKTYSIMKLRADHPDATSDELATLASKKWGQEIRPDSFRQMLRRARLKFAECLVTELAVGLADHSPARISEELAALGLLEYVQDFLPDDWATRGELVGE
jgi:DNA-directed RNA polymerase specialized sigma24 family protein